MLRVELGLLPRVRLGLGPDRWVELRQRGTSHPHEVRLGVRHDQRDAVGRGRELRGSVASLTELRLGLRK